MEEKEFEAWIERMKARRYNIEKDAKCPDCGQRAVVMHNNGVCHGKCSNCNWSTTGFGGPKVMSWAQACAHSYGG